MGNGDINHITLTSHPANLVNGTNSEVSNWDTILCSCRVKFYDKVPYDSLAYFRIENNTILGFILLGDYFYRNFI